MKEILTYNNILNWLKTRFTKNAPIEYVISEFKKEFAEEKKLCK